MYLLSFQRIIKLVLRQFAVFSCYLSVILLLMFDLLCFIDGCLCFFPFFFCTMVSSSSDYINNAPLTPIHHGICCLQIHNFRYNFFFPDPLFPLHFLVNSWVPGMFDSLFQASFLGALLLFWLCAFHGIRQVKCLSLPQNH